MTAWKKQGRRSMAGHKVLCPCWKHKACTALTRLADDKYADISGECNKAVRNAGNSEASIRQRRDKSWKSYRASI
ncbi:hypothetical protein GDO81_000112 [Engystomops pustulosus]|uniref:Uncharacterized protein n=1 Tax=Engystomops pustulosus TaxID=76066 RepID=A0AAV7D2W4_ENGPU|nr:hypothetical protein GDO81_000112 [Engystomops pustulosus]